MQRQIAVLVALTTSAVVLAFLIPLGLLVRNLAQDRALAAADQEARNIAILVSSLHSTDQLPDVVAAVNERSPASTTVVLAEGPVFGTGAAQAPASSRAADVAQGQQGAAFTRTTSFGQRIVVPVLTANGTDVVITDVTTDQLRQGVTTAWFSLGVLGLVLIGLAALATGWASRRIAQPVTAVAEVADRLREGDLEARAEVTGPEETKALAQALNRLGGRIQELLVAERGVAGDLAHRLRTPLTALRIDVDQVPDERLAEMLRDHVARLQRTVDVIVNDARRPVRTAMDSRCELVEVIADRTTFWSALAEDQERPIEVDLPPGQIWVGLHDTDLRDVIDVLIDNVFAHTPEGTGFSVTVHSAVEQVVLVVTDQGQWESATTETIGHTGLGLQIVRRLVEGAGGTVVVQPGTEAAGTTIRIALPRVEAAAPH